MKRATLAVGMLALLTLVAGIAEAQTSKSSKKKVTPKTATKVTTTTSKTATTIVNVINSAVNPTTAAGGSSLTNTDYSNGLKEALKIAANKSAESASMLDGFNKNLDIRIPFPQEAVAVKDYALKLGLKYQVELFEEKLNRAAEEAAKKAAPIFLAAIVNMSFADAAKIVAGDKNAATTYLRNTAGAELANQFKPVVADALSQVAITKYWKPLVEKYNAVTPFLGKQPVQADLEQYVTDKAVDGLFVLVEKEEAKIRLEPVKYGSDLLKKIFGTTK